MVSLAIIMFNDPVYIIIEFWDFIRFEVTDYLEGMFNTDYTWPIQ